MGINILLEHILDEEWEMFVAVQSAQPASCQSAPDKFRDIRGSVFEMWSDDMLASYLVQLALARVEGRNLLTEKYARMDNLIPPLSESPWLDEIVAIAEGWQHVLQRRYPALYARCCRTLEPTGDGRNFSVYLRCELETYGDRTLELYHEMMKDACERGENLSVRALRNLVEKGGYRDLEHAESCLRDAAL